MEEFPGVIFRDGPVGRRGTLVCGPDVWEVLRAIRSARAAEPELDQSGVLALVAQNSGIPLHLVRVAVDYWSTYPDEIDVLVEHADRVEKERREAWERAQDLLGRQ